VILRARVLLALLLASGLVASSAHADAIRKCRSRSGQVLFTSDACPKGFALIQEHQIAPPPAPDAPEAATDATGRVAPAPQAREAPPQETPGVIARAMLAARFGRALSELSTLKTYSMMYQAETGSWPRSPEDLGLDRGTFHTEDIERIDFEPTGAIVATLRPSFGRDRRIWLRPSPTLGGASLRWKCETNLEFGPLLPGLAVSCAQRG
jgi:hypothetical protein